MYFPFCGIGISHSTREMNLEFCIMFDLVGFNQRLADPQEIHQHRGNANSFFQIIHFARESPDGLAIIPPLFRGFWLRFGAASRFGALVSQAASVEIKVKCSRPSAFPLFFNGYFSIMHIPQV